MSLKSAFTDIITVTSGDAVDITRIMALIGFAVFLGLAVYNVVVAHNHFNGMDFGSGLGAVIAATGLAIKMNPDNKTGQ